MKIFNYYYYIFHTRCVINLSQFMRKLLYTICIKEKSSEE
jgi:hypothetical protein